MTEPKRRGRPPKRVDLTAEVMGGIGAEDFDRKPFVSAEAQAYAQRVWSGQSVSVPRVERLRRVAAALEAQGLSMEGVSL
jgi:hypothetical protein